MTNRDAQIKALTEAMSSLPGMKQAERVGLSTMVRAVWATDLVDNWGVSIDPSAAKMESVSVAPPQAGNHGPRVIREKTKAGPEVVESERNATLEEARRVLGPMVADLLGVSSPELAKRVNEARTPQQRQAMLAELQEKIPAPILEAIMRYNAVDPAILVDHSM